MDCNFTELTAVLCCKCTNDYCVFQILVNSVNQPAILYENVTVSEGSPIHRDLLFSPDHQHIYALTDKQVQAWHTHSLCVKTHYHQQTLTFTQSYTLSAHVCLCGVFLCQTLQPLFVIASV